MSELLLSSTAFMLGLLGSTHCLGMCGGIMSALSMNSQSRTQYGLLKILLAYNFGRISSYVIAGVCVGLLGLWLQELHANIGLILRSVSAVLLILMGFYLTGWWRILTVLEQAGEKVWRHIQPLGKRLMPVKSIKHAFLLGTVWGWLPCGLVYSVLSWSATTANVVESALIMLFFGLGTLPALMATGIFAKHLHQIMSRREVRIASGLLVIIFGVWMLVGTLFYSVGHVAHGAHAVTEHHVEEEHQFRSTETSVDVETETRIKTKTGDDHAEHHHH